MQETHRSLRVVVTGTASDAHTWNLIYLQLLLEESGHAVVNLGPCVSDDVLVARCRRARPDLIVFGSVNGHGRHDGARAVELLRDTPDLRDLPVVIGGMLGVAGAGADAVEQALLDAGFDAVFATGDDIDRFLAFVGAVPAHRDGRSAFAAASPR